MRRSTVGSFGRRWWTPSPALAALGRPLPWGEAKPALGRPLPWGVAKAPRLAAEVGVWIDLPPLLRSHSPPSLGGGARGGVRSYGCYHGRSRQPLPIRS